MKKSFKSLIALSLTSILIAGCSSKEEVYDCDADPNCINDYKIEDQLQKNQPLYNRLAREKNDRISRDLTNSFYLDERKSAAIEQGGFKPTLGMNNPAYRGDEYPFNVKYDLTRRYQNSGNGANGVGSYRNVLVDEVFSSSRARKMSDYSYYELGRWQRLCDGSDGRSMDSLDWKYVRKNRDAFPIELFDTCVLPSGTTLSKHGIPTPAEYRSYSKNYKNATAQQNNNGGGYSLVRVNEQPANNDHLLGVHETNNKVSPQELFNNSSDSGITVTTVPYEEVMAKEASKKNKNTYKKTTAAKTPVAEPVITTKETSDLDYLEKEIR